ncbi:cystathionine gamma-synthase family protein [Alkalibacillus haloalkaliphilus]|uniref:cystathionine gamma-synthase family protein n=1 Tax=Alkalibacillus haloalkaliphilus TaxID=94136 RepID=UPI002935CCBC|nr:cystathionine gamma-synthase family protein [Alkalibacillus haloalkaliphilus]MDV2582341.1 cystathionine gamma-synthase family protein [Alkalibacillus haloalkaliphilus]
MTQYKPGTKALWSGEQEQLRYGATQVPVVHSVSYGYEDMDEWHEIATGQREGHIYGRNTNPTTQAFEDKVKELEGAEAATSFSTGMAAISNTLNTFLRPGDRVVTIKDTYGGTNKIFTEFLPKSGVDVVFCETDDHEEIEREILNGCQVLYLESPTNPTLKIIDIERVAKAGHDVGALVIIDGTFASPVNQNPLELGVDLVLHSATKYLGGHSDALGGVVCGPASLIEQIYHYREINGATLSPMSSYLLLRGMKTLHLRVKQQNDNAMKVAQYLKTNEWVEDVFYPGLEDHTGHDIAKKQMKGFGGMLSFSVKGGLETVHHLLPHMKLAKKAASLGCVQTIVGPPRTTSHVECTPEERAAMGIPEGLIRYSAGIEDIEDLINDLDQAFKKLPKELYV